MSHMDDIVERVARAISKERFDNGGIEDDDGWDSATPEIQREYLEQARAAIKAMLPHDLRKAVLQDAWDAINAHIHAGPLPGNGGDKQAQRNGMILASNIVFDLLRKTQDA